MNFLFKKCLKFNNRGRYSEAIISIILVFLTIQKTWVVLGRWLFKFCEHIFRLFDVIVKSNCSIDFSHSGGEKSE